MIPDVYDSVGVGEAMASAASHNALALASRMDDLMSEVRLGQEQRRLGAVMIETGDHVGLSFMISTGIMFAATIFFFFQVYQRS